ncbi:MAG: hypothetical protein KDA60_13125 [Planctomycetales bacterium]|nr:hypothetical protein [Planctomycetales bacterium]
MGMCSSRKEPCYRSTVLRHPARSLFKAGSSC